MKILIGVEGSSASDATVQEKTLRPWPKGIEFKLVTAVDPFFFVRAPQLLDETKKSTKEELEEDAAGLREKGWQVSTDVLLENPRHAIPKLDTEWKADLAVLGSHGRGTFTRLLIGSTAQAVLRHAPCSVEIVRARNSGPRPSLQRQTQEKSLIPKLKGLSYRTDLVNS
jgi:nucleotide-binding universal stress UspA family protein